MKDGYFFFMTRNSRLARPGNNERPQTITSDRFLYDLQWTREVEVYVVSANLETNY